MHTRRKTKNRALIVAISLVVLAAIFVYFYRYNPQNHQVFFPYCVFKLHTGWDCVGCGSQRAVHCLLHGEWVQALDYNLLFVMSLPLLAYTSFFSLRKYILGTALPHSFVYSAEMGRIIIIGIILFFILRNLPYYPFNWLHS